MPSEQDSIYADLLNAKPNSVAARDLIEKLCDVERFRWDNSEGTFRQAKATELKPFLQSRLVSVRAHAAVLIACAEAPDPAGSSLLPDVIAKEKDGEVLRFLLTAAGRYPALESFLKEQVRAQRKHDAKIGALTGLETMLGVKALKFFEEATKPKGMGGYLPRCVAAHLVCDLGDASSAATIANFASQIDGERERGYDSTFLNCIVFLFRHAEADNGTILEKLFTKLRDDLWSSPSLHCEERFYLNAQFAFFRDCPTFERPPIYVPDERLDHFLESTGIPRHAEIPRGIA